MSSSSGGSSFLKGRKYSRNTKVLSTPFSTPVILQFTPSHSPDLCPQCSSHLAHSRTVQRHTRRAARFPGRFRAPLRQVAPGHFPPPALNPSEEHIKVLAPRARHREMDGLRRRLLEQLLKLLKVEYGRTIG